MECLNHYCIYEDGGKCRLESISVDEVGMCACCIYPEIDEGILTAAKKDLIFKLGAI